MFEFTCVYCKKELKGEENFYKFSSKDGGCCLKCLEKKKKDMSFPAEMSITIDKPKMEKIKEIRQIVEGAFRRGIKWKNVSYIKKTFDIYKGVDYIKAYILCKNKEGGNLEDLTNDFKNYAIRQEKI